MRARCSKPFLKLGNTSILALTLKVLERCRLINEVILAVNRKDLAFARKEFVKERGFRKIKYIVKGGASRLRSVYNGLCRVSPQADMVLIHDGVRPFLKEDIIKRVVRAASSCGAAIAAVPASSTIKQAGDGKKVVSTLQRTKLWIAQTPQVFNRKLLLRAYKKAIKQRLSATDDAVLVEKLGHPVKIVMGSYDNIKITTPEDLVVAEVIIKRKKTRRLRVG